MSSVIGNSPTQLPNLKSKVSQVKYMLDGASKRLQDEVSKQEIFATKTSASSMASVKQNGLGQKQGTGVQSDLRRTISDIGTIQSVLSCPIFNRIVNVTDSLDKLSYHLNLRPSIGPSDISIDDNGELILAPPIESTSLSSYINSQLDGRYSVDHLSSPHIVNQQDFSQTNGTDAKFTVGSNIDGHQPMTIMDGSNQDGHMNPNQNLVNDFINVRSSPQQQISRSKQLYDRDDSSELASPKLSQQTNNSQPRQRRVQQANHQASGYDSEKLVTNGNSVNDNESNNPEREVGRTRVKSVAAVFESAINESVEGRRLYKSNGNFALNRMIPNNDQNTESKEAPRIQSGQNTKSSQAVGYSNELYHGAQDLNSRIPSSYQQQNQISDVNTHCAYANGNIRKRQQQAATCNQQNEPKAAHHAQQAERPNRASPSASAGSTVKLADECDSGTSSFRSQAAKGTLYSPQSHKPIGQLDEDSVDDSLDQELIDKLSPEMERIKVTLEKGPEGIGITIAGYTCEQEEISGIFIKGITPGSPADCCGKIRILDQIFAVNGQEILGYSNPEATNVLRRHTGKVVTLELMRYLAESRYQKLQNLLENASPVAHLKKSVTGQNSMESNENYVGSTSMPASSCSVTSDVLTSRCSQNANVDHVLNSQNAHVQAREVQQSQTESIYKNSSVFHNNDSPTGDVTNDSPQSGRSPMPVAAQRCSGITNKVIETKQGARNTVDIRSPFCQTKATATYVNRLDTDVLDSRSNIPIINRLMREAPKGLEWNRSVEIVELQRDSSSQGLGFSLNEYNDPKDQTQSIIMITSITPGGIAEMNGKLNPGDLLRFVDDKNLVGASLDQAVKALKETNGHVRLGVLKLEAK